MEKKANPAPAARHSGDAGAGQAGKLAFLKGGMALLLVWPIAALLIGALLWLTMLSQLAATKDALSQSALKDASALSRAYAQHLTRAIEQVDQITLLIKYEWEQSHRALKLEDLLRQGIFTASRFTLITIIDRNAKPVTATLPLGPPSSMADREYFQFHLNDRSQALRIGKPAIGRISGKTVLQFTRRLETSDGSFDGVVLISIEPEYFASFYDGSSLGDAGMLAILGQDGALRLAKIGVAKHAAADSALHAVPALDAMEGGAALQDAHWFGDRRARFMAAQKLQAYPLIAVIGLSEEERLRPYRATRDLYLKLALIGSIFLFIFACVATLLSTRLAWRKYQEMEVQDAYRLATEGGNDGFYMLRALRDKSGAVVDFEIADCNERGAAFNGVTAAQFLGMRLSGLYPKPYFYTVLDTFRNAMETGFYEDELKIPSESPVRLEWVHRTLVRSGAGLAMTMRDITQTKAHERELWRMANEDALTALPNRNWLMNFLPQTLERLRKENGMLALLFVDLDNFKDVNDSLGHSSGDELLRQAALRLRAVLRPSDNVARLGGDEFTVILEPLADAEEAAQAAARIVQIFDRPFELARGGNSVAASIGICLFPRDGDNAETMLKNSDLAMYHAKAQGKGHYRFYEAGLSERLNARLETERALQQAIEQNQFVLFYQPRIDTRSGELRGLEALVRWRHPVRGLVAPLEFIPLAEETGLILKLGELVLEHACTQIAHWQSLRLPLVPVSINVSPRQFSQGNLRHLFASCLARHRIAPALIEIEITESSMIGEDAWVSAELAAIRALGIKLLVDDFGTGYSSLSQLQRLDMDILKVDRAFTAALGHSPEGEVFFRAIVSMAHALGMGVVAEGIENAEQLRILQMLACDEVQGYYISHPLPAEAAAALLTKRYLLPAEVAPPPT